MDPYNWIEFTPNGPLPPERRYVLVQIAEREVNSMGVAPAVAVGYVRHMSNGPMFVIPGVGGTVTHWCDCLGEDFRAPLWKADQAFAARRATK